MKKSIEMYYKLRMLVGYLGEKSQHGWWPSSFLSPTSSAFLSPVYPRSAALAAYHGVVEAGRVLHDEHIGLGRVFHLFRLPEELEHELHAVPLQRDPDFTSWATTTLSSGDEASRELERLAAGGLTAPEGPVRLGTRNSLSRTEAIEDIARHYVDAFRRGVRCFPYFTESTAKEPASGVRP